MRDLSSTVYTIYTGSYSRYYNRIEINTLPKDETFLVFTLGDTFKIPAFAVETVQTMWHENQITDDPVDLVLPISDRVALSPYKSLDANMRHSLYAKVPGLVKVTVKKGQENIDYYVTHGMVLDATFEPILLCMLEGVKKVPVNEEKTCLSIEKIAMYLKTDIFTGKADPMERFLANKLPTVFLDQTIDGPRYSGFIVNDPPQEFIVSSSFPLKHIHPKTPSQTITNEELLKVALDHIDDTLQ